MDVFGLTFQEHLGWEGTLKTFLLQPHCCGQGFWHGPGPLCIVVICGAGGDALILRAPYLQV